MEYALSIMDEPTDFTRVGFAVTVIAEALRKVATTVRFPRLVAFGSSTAFVQTRGYSTDASNKLPRCSA